MRFILAINIEASTAAQAERTADKICKIMPKEASMQSMGLRTAYYKQGSGWVRDD